MSRDRLKTHKHAIIIQFSTFQLNYSNQATPGVMNMRFDMESADG